MRIFLIFSFLIGPGAAAQIFPIQVNPHLTPPYSPYLSDYTAPGAQKLTIQIRANDISLSQYPCKLRIAIEGAGITIRTKPAFVTRPIILKGSVPQVLSGEDIADYLHPDALDFSGLSRDDFAKSARLPEGVYRFTVEVLDYNRGTVVSNSGMAVAWIMLNDPPLLTVPSDLSKIQIQEPVNILFSWTPRHTGSPNAAFTTEYIFRLTEIWPEDRSADDAFRSQLPLFETTTTQTRLVYGMSDPTLIPGRKYAWQVTARDTEGRDLFKNLGRSEVFSFRYGKALAVPENFQLRWAKPTTLSMRWDPVPGAGPDTKYRLQYRPRKRSENHQWYETLTQFRQKTLYHLDSDTEYEMKVRTEDGIGESAYTETQIFKTLPPSSDAFVCKDLVAPPPSPANTLPVFRLSVNDTLHVGGYDVLVRDVLEVDGKYFGSGVAIVPWLNASKVRVTFEKIRVNDRFWLTSGTVETVWNAESKFLLRPQAPALPGSAPRAGELDITIVAVDSLITIEGASIAAVTINANGNIVVATTDGQEQTLAKGAGYAITDPVGNGYIVDQQGHVAKTTASEARAAAARGDRTYDLKFRFARGDSRFGFDEKRYEALSLYYQELSAGSYAPWKALSSAQADALEGIVESRDVDVRKIRFQRGVASIIPSSWDNGRARLTLQGNMAGMEEEILAVYHASDSLPEKVLGKVNVVTYDPIQYRLEIVPVNGATMPGGLTVETIAERINDIYRQGIVSWQVRVSEGIQVDLAETFDEGETGLFSNYTPDMKKVLNAWGPLQKDTYYLFLIRTPRDPSTLGYMPRNKRAGFVFTEPHRGDSDMFLKTLAHELGHGAFNLKHTFSEHNLPLGTTDNVMDYSQGTTLYKYQWDNIHEPRAMTGLFDDAGDGESVVVGNMAQLKDFANADGSFTFLAPTGIPFTLPSVTQGVKFWTNDVYGDGAIPTDESPDGALIAFTIESQTYRYHKIEGNKSGSGYKIDIGDHPYVDQLGKKQTGLKHAIIGLPCLEGGALKFIARKVRFNSGAPKDNYSAVGTIVATLPVESPDDIDYSTRKINLEAQLDFTYTEEAKAFINDNQACMNEMVQYVIKAANVIQRNPGFYTSYKTCSPYPMKYPEAGETQNETAFLLGLYYEELKGFADVLLEYIEHSQHAYENLLSIEDPDALAEALTSRCEADYKRFTFEQRKHIITRLASGNLHDYWLSLGNNRENIVVYTLRQTPEDQYGQILDLFKTDGYLLLKTLINKCDNQLIGRDNFDALVDAVTVMIQKTSPYEDFGQDIEDDNILKWGVTGAFQKIVYECPEWADVRGKETISFTYHDTRAFFVPDGQVPSQEVLDYEREYHSFEVSPFEFVPLRLFSDEVLNDGTPILKRSVSEFQAVPALYLYWMIHRKATDQTLVHIKADVNLLLFAVGGAEIIAARSGLRLTLAIVDQTLFTSSFVLSAGPRQALESGPHGEDWKSVFKVFDAFNMLYGTMRMGQALGLAAQDVLSQRALLRQLKGTEDWNNYTPAQQHAIKEYLVKAEKGMDELEGKVGLNRAAEQIDDLQRVLNQLSPDLQARLRLVPQQQMDIFLDDIRKSPELMTKMTVAMVDGWEILAQNPVLRKRTRNLEILAKWISEGLEKQKLSIGLRKAPSKQKLIDNLANANSKVHVQVLIKDYEKIPGVVKGRYVPNGSSISDKAELPNGWKAEHDLPKEEIQNFTGRIAPIELLPGHAIYRVSAWEKRGRSYWTPEKPESLKDVIGGTAIEPEWNNFEYLHKYTVPEGITIKGWIGKSARKQVSEEVSSNYHLPGGGDQIFISNINEQDINFESIVISEKKEW